MLNPRGARPSGAGSSLARRGAQWLGVIAVALWVIFFSRCVYNLVAALGVWNITIGAANGGPKTVSPVVFALMAVLNVVLWRRRTDAAR